MIQATSNYKDALASFRAGKIIWTVEIDTYSKVFSNDPGYGTNDWLVSVDDIATSVNDVDGSANQISFGFTVQDFMGAVTADFLSFVYEGKKVTIKTGFTGLAYDDFATVFVGVVDSVASANANNEYYFNVVDTSDRLSQVVFQTGDDGFPTSSDHIKTVVGHPIDIILTILGPTYLNLDTDLIDTSKLEAYRDGPFAGLEFVFRISQAPAALDFIQAQIMKPLGGYLWINAAGQVTANFFYPLAGPVAEFEFGRDTWLSIPEAEQTDMINTVQIQYDKDDADSNASGDYFAQQTEEYGPSIDLYGQYGELVIQADGMRSEFQGAFLTKITSRLYFLRYGFKNLKFDQGAADSIWNTLLLECGEVVSVTHPQIPDRRAGTMGVTNKLFEILGKTIHPETGTITYTMIDADYLASFGFFKIAPTAHVDYAASSGADRAKYMFMASSSKKYTNNDPGNVLG